MELPYNNDDAVVSGLSTQRGGHKPYNDWVKEEVSDILKKYDQSQSTNNPMKPEELEEQLGEFQDTLRCRHNRALSKDAPNQLSLHRGDPNIDLTHDFRTTPEEIGNGADMATYTQRLHAHNEEHNPGHAALNNQAREPQVKTTARPGLPDDKVEIDMGGDDGSCGDDKSRRRDTPQHDDHPSTLAMSVANYALRHPRLASAVVASAEATADLAVVGLTTAAQTRGASLLPVAGAALTTATLATAMAAGMAKEAVAGVPVAGVPLSGVFPESHAVMAQGSDAMGERSEIKRLVIERTNNIEEALTEANYVVLQDGSVLEGLSASANPKMAAGKNGGALGLMYVGEGFPTTAQQATLDKAEASLNTLRYRAGFTQPAEKLAGGTNTALLLGLEAPWGNVAGTTSKPVPSLHHGPQNGM
jgi:hypothetical protein